MKQKIKCFVCKNEFECDYNSPSYRTELCAMCMINGAVTVVDEKGNSIPSNISEENQQEMLKRMEKLDKQLSGEKKNDI